MSQLIGKIKERRKFLKKTQEDMSVDLKISKRQYQRIESGESKVTVERMGEILGLLWDVYLVESGALSDWNELMDSKKL